jgi:8-oxo-dGTP pyrophosphatase MutT (NUDIX family)
MTWRRRIEPLTRPIFFTGARFLRGLTLGVRGLVIDAGQRVLLVEHTYVPGWYLPGGGVERGETAEQALTRELLEEAGVRATTRPKLLSVHDNGAFFPGDHVLVYRVTDFETVAFQPGPEIRAIGWFDPSALPDGATPATRARLREALEGAPPDPAW